MPLKDFIEETMKLLGTDAKEIVVEQAQPFRNNPGPNESGVVTHFNDSIIGARHSEDRAAINTVSKLL